MSDPVGEGFVANLPRPGGNITGYVNDEAATGGKWLELLTQVATDIKRAAFLFNPDNRHEWIIFLGWMETAAQSHNIESIAAPVRNDDDIRDAVRFARAWTDSRPHCHA